ncbi:MAG: hypothetical protein A2Z90_19065 [Burkholderiales bacterium GWA2_64_37]|nr:MAG: hypothetical protein A2Z90_19065 [Burkholderiales bacterium GWA2_64_37]HCE94978.1 hypothetical protein [Acidovorax sp.]
MANQARRRTKGANHQAAASNKSSSWFLMLFALPFSAVGIGMLLLGVLPTLYDWSRMQFWHEVPARVVSAQLNTHRGSKSGSTYSVSAHYRYEVAGVAYDGHRPAINTSADNIGSFHANLASRLESAQRSGTPVPVWVNPSRPQDSVADRSLRLGLLGFRMIFVVVFGGVGLGMLAWGWHMRRSGARKAQRLQALGDEPWLANKAWAGNRIRSNKRWEVWLAWGFAVVWGGIAYPAALSAMPRAWRNENYLVLGVLGLLVAVGLGLLVWAVRATLDARRHGEVCLVMDPFPGSIGGHVGATMDLPTVPYRPDLRFAVTLRCAYHYQTRTGGGDNSSESREQVVWQGEGAAQVQPQGTGSRVAFRLNVPKGLPESEQPVDTSEHHWTVLLESPDPALQFSRRFEVPVYATGAESTWLAHDAAKHPQMQALREAELDAVSDIDPVEGGVRLYQPYGRLWRQNLLWLVMGGVFFGMGMWAGYSGAPALFPVVFGGVGGAMLLWGFYAVSNSLTVQLDREGLRTERRLLGLMLAWQRVPAKDIARLRIKESYTQQSGHQHTTFFRVQVHLRNGKSVTIADSLRGRPVAEQMLDRLAQATGYPR